jgi:hypothetical protein
MKRRPIGFNQTIVRGIEMQTAGSETIHSLKAQMMTQLRLLGVTTPGRWEEAVFRVLTGHTRDELDWSYRPNITGYRHWVATFGQLVAELVLEGLVKHEQRDGQSLVFTTAPMGLNN